MARNTKRIAKADRIDIYEEVTNQIVEFLEAGTRPWSPSWASGAASLPLRHEGTPYRGINILLLWSASMLRGYNNPYWMTYRQAHELGAQVRKGEKGNLVVHAGTFTPKDDDTGERNEDEGEDRTRKFLKKYVVFNIEQIDGLDIAKYPPPEAWASPTLLRSVPRPSTMLAALPNMRLNASSECCEGAMLSSSDAWRYSFGKSSLGPYVALPSVFSRRCLQTVSSKVRAAVIAPAGSASRRDSALFQASVMPSASNR